MVGIGYQAISILCADPRDSVVVVECADISIKDQLDAESDDALANRGSLSNPSISIWFA